MTDLHPHWQSTGDDEVRPLPRPTPTPRRSSHIALKPAARMPGALMGIALFTVAGFTLMGGWQSVHVEDLFSTWTLLTAQVSETEMSSPQDEPRQALEIHIEEDGGFVPESLTVKPGETITWVNDQTIPHILTSQTLRNDGGNYLNTPAIFPGRSESFTVGESEPDKMHIIASTTDQTVRGTIIVSANAQGTTTSQTATGFGGGLEDVNLPLGQGTSGQSSSRSSVASSRAPTAVVPAQDLQPSIESYGSPVYAANDYPPLTPAPPMQPHTGPGLWLVAAMSTAVLWKGTRKYFRRI